MHSNIRMTKKDLSINPRLKLITEKKYKFPRCYDNNLQILHVPKI